MRVQPPPFNGAGRFGLGTIAETVPAVEHLVQFYEEEQFLCAAVTNFLNDGLRAGDSLIVIATGQHWQAFRVQLESLGTDVISLCETGRLTILDAYEALSKFMRNGEPDRQLFQQSVGRIVSNCIGRIADTGRLRAYGEMVDVLWRGDERQAALCLEQLWNDLQAQHSFTLLCAYGMGRFYREPAELQRVCAAHTHVQGPDGRTHATDLQATALPFRYARRLGNEIAHRGAVEKALRECLRDLRTQRDELRRSEEQLRDFVENATLGLHRVGPDGTILWANRAELDLLGYAAEEYVGRNIANFHADPEVIGDIRECQKTCVT